MSSCSENFKQKGAKGLKFKRGGVQQRMMALTFSMSKFNFFTFVGLFGFSIALECYSKDVEYCSVVIETVFGL